MSAEFIVYGVLANSVAVLCLAFGCSLVADVGFVGLFLLLEDFDTPRIRAAAEYTTIAVILFGAALAVLGGVVVAWDALASAERGVS